MFFVLSIKFWDKSFGAVKKRINMNIPQIRKGNLIANSLEKEFSVIFTIKPPNNAPTGVNPSASNL